MPVKDTIKVSDELGYSANTPDRKSTYCNIDDNINPALNKCRQLNN